MDNQISEEIFNPPILLNKVEKLGDRDVHLWGLNRSIYNTQKSYFEYLLNNEEQDRAKRFRFRKDHDLFVIGRFFTKIMLAFYTNCSPESVKIIEDSLGKPTCELTPFFNISHSEDRLLMGFSNSEIGVDIESIDPSVDLIRIGKSHFSEIEFQKMMDCTKGERVEVFFEIWTKKEAVVKGIGKGLSIPLQNFTVTNLNGKVIWELPTEKDHGNWYVQHIETTQGYKSALATQSEFINVSYFSHDK